MRMNRRAFSLAPTVSAPPVVGGTYLVKIWDIAAGADWNSAVFPDGVYGSFEEGATVEVDLNNDNDIIRIANVTSYNSPSVKVSYQQLDDLRVSFTMPGFDVAVEVETNY